jgi:hypothetical protein
MQDHFQLHGPNGTHECLVLELLGPSVADVFDARFNNQRLPGGLARKIAKQTLLGLAYLHEQGIGHAGRSRRPGWDLISHASKIYIPGTWPLPSLQYRHYERKNSTRNWASQRLNKFGELIESHWSLACLAILWSLAHIQPNTDLRLSISNLWTSGRLFEVLMCPKNSMCHFHYGLLRSYSGIKLTGAWIYGAWDVW